MEIVVSLTKENRKRFIFWTLYSLFFLFNVSLAWESYIEYEAIAGNIFTGICAALVVLGIVIYFYLRARVQKLG